ncbi:hypothetical protein VTG60DRAFT_2272 [Thermothelomyces hinnuleus]
MRRMAGTLSGVGGGQGNSAECLKEVPMTSKCWEQANSSSSASRHHLLLPLGLCRKAQQGVTCYLCKTKLIRNRDTSFPSHALRRIHLQTSHGQPATLSPDGEAGKAESQARTGSSDAKSARAAFLDKHSPRPPWVWLL